MQEFFATLYVPSLQFLLQSNCSLAEFTLLMHHPMLGLNERMSRRKISTSLSSFNKTLIFSDEVALAFSNAIRFACASFSDCFQM